MITRWRFQTYTRTIVPLAVPPPIKLIVNKTNDKHNKLFRFKRPNELPAYTKLACNTLPCFKSLAPTLQQSVGVINQNNKGRQLTMRTLTKHKSRKTA